MTTSKQQKQPMRPDYSAEEAKQAADLCAWIDSGDLAAYGDLTRLAVAVVREGRWFRDE